MEAITITTTTTPLLDVTTPTTHAAAAEHHAIVGEELPPSPSHTTKKDLLHDEILPRLERIKKICGPLCEIDSKESLEAMTVVQNKNNKNNDDTTFHLSQVRVPIHCQQIMESADIDAGDTSVPYPLPKEIQHLYSLSGAIRIRNWSRMVNVYLGGKGHEDTNKWDEKLIATIIRDIENGTHKGTYGTVQTNQVRDHLRNTGKIQGSRVLVIGSERPWLEALCLLLGAKDIVTLEYGTILSTHPRIQTLTPLDFRKQYMDGTLGQFDTVVSFSSLEHSGLGRYGDALNPWGDLLAVTRAWCVTRPGGALALGLPTGMDYVTVNAHRVYGKVRWPLITANWIQVDSHLHNTSELENDNFKGYEQSLMVFEKDG